MQDNTIHPGEFSDTLSQFVAAGDINGVRRYFDAAFQLPESEQPKPTWAHLNLAILRHNRPMIKLLVVWGAAATAEDLQNLERQSPEEYAERLRVLKVCGMKMPPPLPSLAAKKAQRDTVLKDFVDGRFVDHRIKNIPAEARQFLYNLQAKAPETFISGSGLCDAFNKKAAPTLDYYLYTTSKKPKNDKKRLKEVLNKSGLKLGSDEPEISTLEVDLPRTGLLSIFFSTCRKDLQTRKYVLTTADDSASHTVTFIDIVPFKKITPDQLNRTVSKQYSVCMDQVSCDGRSVWQSPRCKAANESMEVDMSSQDSKTLDRLMDIDKKYTDRKLSYWARLALSK